MSRLAKAWDDVCFYASCAIIALLLACLMFGVAGVFVMLVSLA